MDKFSTYTKVDLFVTNIFFGDRKWDQVVSLGNGRFMFVFYGSLYTRGGVSSN